MTNISNFQTIASQVEKGLVKKDAMRDELLKLSREIIKNSGQSIESFHRQDFEQSKKKLQLAEDLVNEISSIIKGDIIYQQIGIIGVAMQEYAEAKLLYELIKGDKLLPLDEINVNEQSYLLGVADLIGELRRYILEKLVENKVEEAKKYYGIMKEI
ncbi:MAG: haloacid dehalogenase, partial [Candidatus Heimdallarchaeaceae archaeon]